MRREAQRSQKVTLQTAPKARRLCREVRTSTHPYQSTSFQCQKALCLIILFLELWRCTPWITNWPLKTIERDVKYQFCRNGSKLYSMVLGQNLILLVTLKLKNVAPLFHFLVHCLSLKTLWNSLTFCKTRSVTNNKDLTSPFDKLLLCTCRCHTDVKFWYVHFIFSWNVLVTNSTTVNAMKTYLYFASDATVLEEIWESGKRTQKESRKGSNGTAKTWWWVQRGEDSPSLLISWLVNVLLMFKLSSASSYWSVFQFNAFVYITRHRRIPCRRRQSGSCFLTVHVHCQNYS